MPQPVFLVNLGNQTKWISIPFGLAFLGKALRNASIDFELIDLLPVSPDDRKKHFCNYLEKYPGAVYGFSLVIGNSNLHRTMEYIELVKKISPDSIVVLGGPLATAIPELLFTHTQTDYIIQGEGEKRFVDLLLGFSQKSSCPSGNGILSRHHFHAACPEGGAEINALKKIKNLDDYSPPLYEIFNMDFYTQYLRATGRSFDISASRGCWGRCKFCFKFMGSGYNCRSADSIIDEIAHIIAQWKINRFAFVDENFFQNKTNFLTLLEMAARRGVDFHFRCMTRVDSIDEEIAAALAQANITGVSFGIESVNDTTLANMNKRITIKEIENKIDLLHKLNIEARASFIIGFPDDTEDDFENMYDFILRNGLQGHCTINFLTPLPRTKLLQEVWPKIQAENEWHYVKRVDRASLYRELVCNLTNLPDHVLLSHRDRLKEIGQAPVEIPFSFSRFLKADTAHD